MRFLVIGINYVPEQTSVAPFTTGVCEHLVQRGHDVSVITAFPYYPQWRIHDGYRGALYKREQVRGVDVRRVIHFVPSKPRDLVQRLLHDVTFSSNALLATPWAGKFDGIFCSCPPPFVPTVAWLASRLRGVPFAVKLTDLAADTALALGIMKKQGALGRWARTLEGFNFRRAAGISVLCPGFKQRLVDRGIAEEKIFVVPDWADVETVRPLPRENEFRNHNHLADSDFLALHAGNMGLKQGLHTVVEAARLAEIADSGNGATWMLVGDGEERQRLQQIATEYGTTVLRFLPLQPESIFPHMLAAADVLLMLQRTNVTDMVIPSKLLTYMASGRPIVASVNHASETANRIREADCGLIVPPEDASALLNAVEHLRAAPEEAQRLGRNGRVYVEAAFSKQIVLEMYDQFFGNVFPGFDSTNR